MNDDDSESGPQEVDWVRIRDVYEHDHATSCRAICETFGTTKFKLQKHVVDEGWTPRRKVKEKQVSRAKLIRRMLQALDREMTRIEASDDPADRKVSALAIMSRTLAKLLQTEASRRHGQTEKSKAPASAELALLREKIAKRIEQLNQG